MNMDGMDLTDIPYQLNPVELVYPNYFIKPSLPANNPMSVDGIALGRKLFFDPILSADATMSCASCHMTKNSFTDLLPTSKGIDGINGRRSSMALINLAFNKSGLFWDGRSATLEDQALEPVEDPVEMHNTWPNVVDKMVNHADYPSLFRKAFGIDNSSEITKELAAKAMAQFERSLVSSDSKYDKILREEAKYSDLELYGFYMYTDADPDIPDAECGHCHSLPMATADAFFNNGLDEAPTLEEFKDKGLGMVTMLKIDNGKFKAPTLRNIMLTSPYMHDGRFSTIEEVIDHYNSGGKDAPNKDSLIKPLGLNSFQKRALKAFLSTFTDTTFVNNVAFGDPAM